MGIFKRFQQWKESQREKRVDELTSTADELTEDRSYDLLFLFEKGFVHPRGSGESITRIYIEIENLIRKKIRVTIKPGTYFLASGNYQNMATTSEYSITLQPLGVEKCGIDAVCINADRPIPNKSNHFNGVAQVSPDVAGFIVASKDENRFVIQAGIWTLTNNYTRVDVMTRLVLRDHKGNITQAVTHEHCDRAVEILESLGLKHRLWKSLSEYERKKIEGEDFTYEGEFRYGEFHGFGKFTFSNGVYYEGEWNNEHCDGYGLRTYEDGSRHTGRLKNWKSEGPGIWEYNGEKLVGLWENDKLNEGWKYKENGSKVWFYRDDKGEIILGTINNGIPKNDEIAKRIAEFSKLDIEKLVTQRLRKFKLWEITGSR